jgi:hypothetical protein
MPDAAAIAITRRQGLLALALIGPIGVLAACTSSAETSPVGSSAAASLAPADASAQHETELIALYDAVLAAYPDLPPETVAVLTTLRDQHVQHRDALGGSPDATAEATVPENATAALAALVSAEHVASRERIRACVDSTDAPTARLLALIGAAEAAHVPALRDLRA